MSVVLLYLGGFATRFALSLAPLRGSGNLPKAGLFSMPEPIFHYLHLPLVDRFSCPMVYSKICKSIPEEASHFEQERKQGTY
jgi:hypothetical protein